MRNYETQIQIALVSWIKTNFPTILFTASAGGMRTNIGTAIKMKKMGYRAGCPDLIFFVSRGGYHGLLIELKQEGGNCTPEQKEFIMMANLAGYMASFAFGYDDAVNLINTYMNLK